MFVHQTFDPHDLAIIGLLVVLEGVLSIDNALVLGLLAKRLPRSQQARALTLGLVGAFVFRFISIATAAMLLKFMIVKLVGGVYLFYVAGKYFVEKWTESHETEAPESETPEKTPDTHRTGAERASADGSPATPAGSEGTAFEATTDPYHAPSEAAAPHKGKRRTPGFWTTVLVIELTDIAFAVDSILAAIALVGSRSEKLWVIITGGMLGVILMRYAATVFIRMLEKFPRFETAAYLLVALIGAKLTLDWTCNQPNQPPVLDFHSLRSPAFWAFWILMVVCFCIGFVRPRSAAPGPSADIDAAHPPQPDSVN